MDAWICVEVGLVVVCLPLFLKFWSDEVAERRQLQQAERQRLETENLQLEADAPASVPMVRDVDVEREPQG